MAGCSALAPALDEDGLRHAVEQDRKQHDAEPADEAETGVGPLQAEQHDLAEALGAPLTFVGNYRLDYLCELPDEAVVRDLRPDHARLLALRTRGVVVTARSTRPGVDFVSRYFAPGYGVAEDPVTGSAHCALAPYWQERVGRPEMLAWQASPRGGRVRVTVRGDRVLLGGHAVTVARGVLV